MTTYRANGPAAIGTSSFGNAVAVDGKATITAALTTNDEVILVELPAGFRLQELAYRNGDLDSGTTLAFNLGYRSTHPNQEVAANATYFLSGSTAGQGAQNSWVPLTFDPITFNEPVQIVLKPTANATGLAASAAIFALAKGIIQGLR